MDDEARIHSWNAWLQYVAEWRQAPYLPDMSKHDQQEILLAFGARVRTRFFGKKRQVGAQSVDKAMRHVAHTLVLAGFTDPSSMTSPNGQPTSPKSYPPTHTTLGIATLVEVAQAVCGSVVRAA